VTGPLAGGGLAPPATLELSKTLVALYKGVLYRDESAPLWAALHTHRGQVADHVALVGLDLVVNEAEGYAFLRQATYDDVDFPRLIPRHRLSFRLSLMLALLRKRLAEFDASSSDAKLVVSREHLVETMRVHLTELPGDVQLVREVDRLIGKASELGFLRPLKSGSGDYEVRRVLKAYVDGEWLDQFQARLCAYLELARGEDADG
jgi:hypothetical protein